jgi:hypothetical protein
MTLQNLLHYGLPIALACVYLALQFIYGRRSQIDAWCEARPKIAGVMKLLRAVFPDPWLLVQGLTLLVKGRLPIGYKTIAETVVKILSGLLVFGVLFGCTQAKAPTALDVATAAAVVTDDALAAAIASYPADAGTDMAPWDARVAALKKAVAIVEAAGDLCPMLPLLGTIAADIGCTQCAAPIALAKEQLKCQ